MRLKLGYTNRMRWQSIQYIACTRHSVKNFVFLFRYDNINDKEKTNILYDSDSYPAGTQYGSAIVTY